MSVESIIGVIHQHYQPSMFFCAGLMISIVFCLLALAVETKFRRREFESLDADTRIYNYRQFRRELIATVRHVGFTGDEIHELEDHEFQSE